MSFCNSKETITHDLVTERRRANNLVRFKLKYNKKYIEDYSKQQIYQ